MFLFIISFVFIFISGFFIASILSKKDAVKGFIYTLLIAYSQIILTSQILSIFNSIKEIPFIFINAFSFIISTIIWLKLNKPIWKFELKEFTKKFFNALKLDKSLIFLFLSWIIFIASAIYLIILLPSTSGDANSYHVVRSVDWVINHSLAHFSTQDIRINSFPINSELLYMWILLFTKKQLFFGIFSFIGYLLCIICGYNLFKYLGYSMRRTLWSFFIMSSLASVVVMVSGTETDIIIAGLILTSIYLFINALKNNSNNITLFMSSLAYAIAIGVKTPAILCIPAVGMLFIYFSIKQKDKYSILKFIGFGIINFILFSAFNYIQNFYSYGNIMGQEGAILAHKNLFGIKGFISSFIKHIFLLFDFSGIKVPLNVGDFLINLEKNILTYFHVNNIPNGIYCGSGFFNGTLVEPVMGCGLLSFLLILPCIILSLLRPLFIKCKRTIIEFMFALAFILNISVLSATIAFMTYNTRFLTCFILISLPIIAISYIKSNKNLIKIIYIIIAIFYLTIISTHLWARPVVRLTKSLLTKQTTVQKIRSQVPCYKYDKRSRKLEEWCNISSLLNSKFDKKEYRVLFLPSFSENVLYLRILKLKGYQYDFKNLEDIKKFNPNDYDIIVIPELGQAITGFEKFSEDKIDYILNEQIHYPLDPKAEILCYYNSIDTTMSRQMNTHNRIPINKVCNLTMNFFNKYPFEHTYRTEKHYILLNKKTFNKINP